MIFLIRNWKIIAAAGILAAVAACTWAIQGWRYGLIISDMKLKSEQSLRKAENDYNARMQQAQNERVTREAALRVDANRARSAADKLRQQLRERSSDPTLSACTVRANAVSELFGSCVNEYQQLAEKTDRHSNDVKTMINSWPR